MPETMYHGIEWLRRKFGDAPPGWDKMTPSERGAQSGGLAVWIAAFQQGVRRQGRVPDRREARLAVGFIVLDHQQLLDRTARGGAIGVLLVTAKRVVHHHRVRHGREDRAQAVLAVQALVHEGDRLGDRDGARRIRVRLDIIAAAAGGAAVRAARA